MVLSLSQKKFCGDGKIAGDYHTHVHVNVHLNLYVQVDTERYHVSVKFFIIMPSVFFMKYTKIYSH